jgi:5'(3')-deoxyribonucleotidase
MSKPIIFLDYDDVIVDWCGPACALMGVNLDNPQTREVVETVWGGINKFTDEAKMWDAIDTVGPKFWADLPILPWGRRLWDEMNQLGEVCFLSSPSAHPSCAAGKVESFKKLFDTRSWFIGKKKYLAAGRHKILIDDRPSNCERFVAAGGQAFLWPSATKMLRLGNGDEMVDRAIAFVKQVIHRLDTEPNFSSYCTPDGQVAEI